VRGMLCVAKRRRAFGAQHALRLAFCAAAIGIAGGYALAGSSLVGAIALADSGNPLSGARFFVDRENAVSVAARDYPELAAIADQPGTARFGAFSGNDVGRAVHDYLLRASRQEPGTVPMLATYRIVDGHCGNWTPTVGDEAGYHAFITSFAGGIGGRRAVLFLEMDSIITVGCLTPRGVTIRMNELHDAINVLTSHCPRLVIYLDAGAGDAVQAPRVARLLERAGIAQIQGFFLNSTHFDWTSAEIRFGDEVSRLTGGKHFVVNTGENGRGPLVPRDRVHQGNEVLCNPPGRGLGPRPTTNTGYPNVDAFAWTSNPGESGGACVPGAPPMGAFWPAYALMLVHNANYADRQPGASPARASRRPRGDGRHTRTLHTPAKRHTRTLRKPAKRHTRTLRKPAKRHHAR